MLFLAGISLSACSGDTSPRTFHLERYRNKWVFINYWASWCESCKLEIPAFNAFAQRYPKRAVILGVNYDHLQGDALKQAIAKMHIQFKVLTQDPAVSLKLGFVTVVPTTFVFDPHGTWVTTLLGPQNQHSLMKVINP